MSNQLKKKSGNLLNRIIEELYPSFKGMNEYFEKNSRSGFSAFCHSELSGGISRQIRNTYRLWEDNIYTNYFKKKYNNEIHADEMSSIIVKGIWDKHHKENNKQHV